MLEFGYLINHNSICNLFSKRRQVTEKKDAQKLTAAPEQEPRSDPRSGSLSSERDKKILEDQIPESVVNTGELTS